MNKRIVLFLMSSVVFVSPVWSQIVIKNGNGSTLDDLIRNEALTTIVLNGGARDPNLTITGINKTTVTFETVDEIPGAHPIVEIREIVVQGESVATKKKVFSTGSLSRDELDIIDRTLEQVFSIFEKSQDHQEIRIWAASIMAAMGDDQPLGYLLEKVNSTDLPTAISASWYIYLAGEKIDQTVIQEGFLNGNRRTRSDAAFLAGLSGDEVFLKDLREMLKDTTSDGFPYAVRALAMLDDDSSLPIIYKGLSSLSQPKSEASIYALIKIGSNKKFKNRVITDLQGMLPNAGRNTWFRITRVLYALGDEDAAVDMRKRGLKQFAFEQASGLLLGENEDWDGGIWIREYLQKKKDPDYKNLVYRANLGHALYDSAEAQAKIVFQQLLRMSESDIYARGFNNDIGYKRDTMARIQIEVCRLLGTLGDKSMLTILTGAMADADLRLSLTACDAIVQIANPEYRDRVKRLAESSGYRELMMPNVFK